MDGLSNLVPCNLSAYGWLYNHLKPIKRMKYFYREVCDMIYEHKTANEIVWES